MAEYQFNTRTMHNTFCPACGIRVFGRGHVEELGGDLVAINVACLDTASDAELAAAPVRFSNGRDNDWMHAPQVTGYL